MGAVTILHMCVSTGQRRLGHVHYLEVGALESLDGKPRTVCHRSLTTTPFSTVMHLCTSIVLEWPLLGLPATSILFFLNFFTLVKSLSAWTF